MFIAPHNSLAALPNLSIELLDKIFCLLDAVSATSFGLTCKTCYELYRNIYETNDVDTNQWPVKLDERTGVLDGGPFCLKGVLASWFGPEYSYDFMTKKFRHASQQPAPGVSALETAIVDQEARARLIIDSVIVRNEKRKAGWRPPRPPTLNSFVGRLVGGENALQEDEEDDAVVYEEVPKINFASDLDSYPLQYYVTNGDTSIAEEMRASYTRRREADEQAQVQEERDRSWRSNSVCFQ